MVKKIILFFLIITMNKYFSQEICDPSDLEATSGNKNIFLSWKDINDTSIETVLFEECFELCTPTGTITHLVDNGNGGWYRGTDGNAYCANGFECNNLEDPSLGWAAIAWWTAEPGVAVDSRMVFGPFDISSDASATLEFFEGYYFGEMLVDTNVVEISFDDGNSWQSIYTSDPSILNFWTAASVDLSNYSGQRIYIGFRYTDTGGDREAWLIDEVKITELIEPEEILSLNNEFSNFSSNQMYNSRNALRNESFRNYESKTQDKRVNKEFPKNGMMIAERPEMPSSNIELSAQNSRNCSNPDEELEVSIVLTEGSWPSEISWYLSDSTTGEVILSGEAPSAAPFDTVMCLEIGTYTFSGLDSYGDGWNGSVMTITNIVNGSEYLNFTFDAGFELVENFFLGPNYGCIDPFALNYDPLANTDDGSCEYETCNENLVYLYCSPGFWPTEVSWYVYDSIGSEIISGGVDQYYSICVPTGTYKVIGADTYGDGWNSAYLSAVDTSDNILLNWSFDDGFSDSTYFFAGPKYGCTDPRADNFDPSATIDDSTCVYANCGIVSNYEIYKNGALVNTTTNNFHSFVSLDNGTEYEVGVKAIYDEGQSNLVTISAIPWNDVTFDPLAISFDTLSTENILDFDFSFTVDQDIWYTSPYNLNSDASLDIDYSNSMLYSGFNDNEFTTMYDPSGLFGGLWLLGDPTRASSNFFPYDSTLDSTNFAYINDDAIGAAGGAESAYLITNEITRLPGQRVFATFDVYFPQLYESCSSPNGGINGEGFSEDLFFMVSFDYGGTWTIIDSTLGGNPNWTSRMFDITNHLNGATSFIAALYYTDCGGNWAFGVGIDNFAIHLADDNEIIIIDPYAGWAEAGSTIEVGISVLNQPFNFVNTTLQLNAGYENFTIPVYFGLTLGIDDEAIDIIPVKNTLHQNYPNPFNPTTTIPFDIVNSGQVNINIYNIKGEMVRTLVNSNLNPGSYEVRWDGRSVSGINISAGMYFIELKGTNFRETSKMIYLK